MEKSFGLKNFLHLTLRFDGDAGTQSGFQQSLMIPCRVQRSMLRVDDASMVKIRSDFAMLLLLGNELDGNFESLRLVTIFFSNILNCLGVWAP